MPNSEVARVEELKARILSLSPLEEHMVKEFEQALADLFAVGTLEAALVLFDALDDRCELGGVMQTATGVLSEFQTETVLQVLVKRLPDGAMHRREAISDVIRQLLLNGVARKQLRSVYERVPEASRAMLRELLTSIGRFKTYGPHVSEVLATKSA